ncbi:MAG: NAD(P)-binding domain-containing protein [Thermoleophilaceae bacterium]
MEITIIGTGNMARAIGTRAIAGGHDVTIVGKDEASAQEVVSELAGASGDGGVSGAAQGDPVTGDVVVLAVYYSDARDAVEQRANELTGKIVIDITNPVNESMDALVVPPDGSATDELAKLAPEARFVKAFNTTFAGTLVDGEVAGQPLDVLIAGDDEDAKQVTAALARDGGLNPVEVGGQARARELEALGLLHMGAQAQLGTNFASAVKIVA